MQGMVKLMGRGKVGPEDVQEQSHTQSATHTTQSHQGRQTKGLKEVENKKERAKALIVGGPTHCPREHQVPDWTPFLTSESDRNLPIQGEQQPKLPKDRRKAYLSSNQCTLQANDIAPLSSHTRGGRGSPFLGFPCMVTGLN